MAILPVVLWPRIRAPGLRAIRKNQLPCKMQILQRQIDQVHALLPLVPS